MIYQFDFPHKVGTVCGLACPVCGDIEPYGWMTDENGRKMPPQPLFIIREATYEEHVASLAAMGARGGTLPGKYYYEVSTD